MNTIKTKKGWQESKQDLSQYLQPGDIVDEDMFDYFLEVMPPTCQSDRCLQIGEPFTHDDKGRPMFSTLEKINGQWTYTGIKVTFESEKCLYIY
jgi:hypothetical protein